MTAQRLAKECRLENVEAPCRTGRRLELTSELLGLFYEVIGARNAELLLQLCKSCLQLRQDGGCSLHLRDVGVKALDSFRQLEWIRDARLEVARHTVK